MQVIPISTQRPRVNNGDYDGDDGNGGGDDGGDDGNTYQGYCPNAGNTDQHPETSCKVIKECATRTIRTRRETDLIPINYFRKQMHCSSAKLPPLLGFIYPHMPLR